MIFDHSGKDLCLSSNELHRIPFVICSHFTFIQIKRAISQAEMSKERHHRRSPVAIRDFTSHPRRDSRLNKSSPSFFHPSPNDRQQLILESVQRYYLPSQKRKVADSYFPLAFYPFFDPGEKRKKRKNEIQIPFLRISTHNSINNRLIARFEIFFKRVISRN